MAKSVGVGDKVEWESSGGSSTGKVIKKVAASTDNLEYFVESEKSGRRAAHKASALKKA